MASPTSFALLATAFLIAATRVQAASTIETIAAEDPPQKPIGQMRGPFARPVECALRKGEGKMEKKDIKVAYGVDVDAVAGWLGSYGGEDSPDDISRGIFAGEVGVPRLLKLFSGFGIKDSISFDYIFRNILALYPGQYE